MQFWNFQIESLSPFPQKWMMHYFSNTTDCKMGLDNQSWKCSEECIVKCLFLSFLTNHSQTHSQWGTMCPNWKPVSKDQLWNLLHMIMDVKGMVGWGDWSWSHIYLGCWSVSPSMRDQNFSVQSMFLFLFNLCFCSRNFYRLHRQLPCNT